MLALGLGDGELLDGAGAGFGEAAGVGEPFGAAEGEAEVLPVPEPVSPVGASVPGALLPAVNTCLPP